MIDQGHITDSDDRTKSPFAAVIAEYRRHAVKTACRTRPEATTRRFRRKDIIVGPVRIRAMFYYNAVAAQLETL